MAKEGFELIQAAEPLAKFEDLALAPLCHDGVFDADAERI